jgi:hypothetical protein
MQTNNHTPETYALLTHKEFEMFVGVLTRLERVVSEDPEADLEQYAEDKKSFGEALRAKANFYRIVVR